MNMGSQCEAQQCYCVGRHRTRALCLDLPSTHVQYAIECLQEFDSIFQIMLQCAKVDTDVHAASHSKNVQEVPRIAIMCLSWVK